MRQLSVLKKLKLRTASGLSAGLLMFAALVAPAATVHADTGAGTCQNMTLSVALAEGQPADQTVSGRLCTPLYWSGSAHQLDVLVAGATYNKMYWDWPTNSPLYSYTTYTLLAGRATFAYDNIGDGASSHPLSTSVTIEANSFVLHQIIQHFAATHNYGKIDSVGHSMGSLIALDEAAAYNDVAGVVATGFIHNVNFAELPAAETSVYPAAFDPQFATSGLDLGYLTTIPGARQSLFYSTATSSPSVIAYDEAHKDVVSGTEFGELVTQILLPPATSPSAGISVPVYELVGQQDNIFCGTVNCTSASQVQTHDAPYYPLSPSFSAAVMPATGHDLALHYTAPATFALINAWMLTH